MNERSIFAAALDIADPVERAAYLEKACGPKPGLRQHVDDLLAAQEKLGSFLASPLAMPQGTVTHEAVCEGPGSRIGDYKLLQQIGEGGMGVVYMAEQLEPVRRKVALKIIKPGMDTKQVIARFEAERQALAMMDHLNIARVFDAGTTGGEPGALATGGGRPYFVMELVHGVPITKFCDDGKLTPRERLQLFIPICQAIQHAHQKGIIHRDIKPSNVLVTMYDDKPVPKVIDFGVAKAVEQRLTEKTLFTQYGALVGTFEYMSPEQAEMNAFGVDTRGDIYSLGVLLYELLTGTTPLESKRLREAALDELVRLIKEEEPQRPSVRLSSSGTLAKIAAARKTEPAQLSKLVRGELDWIAMKCLEKDRSRRYETASGLAKDVDRYLKDEPVEACPPSAGYRMRKFARKYKKALVTAGTIAALLVLGTAVSAWQAVRATELKTAAVLAEQQTRKALGETQDARDETAKALKESQDYAKRLKEEKLAVERLRYVSDMRLAQNAGDQGDYARMRELLAAHRPQRPGDIDLRGFEWDYWDRIGDADSLHTIKGHTNMILGLAFSHDSRRLASCSLDGYIKIWDPVTGKHLKPLRRHTSGICCVAFSPDSRLLASASWDKSVRVWNPDTADELKKLDHPSAVFSVAFSPDGGRLASGGLDKIIRIWDAVTGQLLLTLKGHTSDINSVAFSLDGRWLASTSQDKTVRIWDPATGQELLTLTGHTKNVPGMAFSPDSKQLASASNDGSVMIWDPATGKQLASLTSTPGFARSVAFSPDGRQLAVGKSINIVEVWDLATRQPLQTYYGHTLSVEIVAFSPDGRWLASGSHDKTVKIWDLVNGQKGQKVLAAKGHSKLVGSVAFSPDGRWLASGSEDQSVKIWNPITGQELLTLKGHTSNVTSVAFSPDGRRLVSGASNSITKIWNPATGDELLTFTGARRVVFSPDGKQLASASISRTTANLKIWDAATGQMLRTLTGHTGGVWNVAFSPDGRRLASGSDDNTARIWDPGTGKLLLTLKGHTGFVLGVAFSPDGQRLATGSNDGTIKLWDVTTGHEVLTLEGHAHNVVSVDFSPDGRRLASAGQDGNVKLWDLATGRELLSLKDQNVVVGPFQSGSVVFSPDGKRLAAACGQNRNVMIWDATPRAAAAAQAKAVTGNEKEAMK